MTASQHTRFASPVTLLREWSERADGADLHEALFMGFSADLPALEQEAVSLARGLSARVAVFEDAARGHYDPADVRGAGRDYLYAPVVARAVFRPKLALLLGEHACRVAIGSGHPATADWAGNDRLWTVVETEDDASHALLADVADWLEKVADPNTVAMAPWAAAYLQDLAGLLTERHILAPDAPVGGGPDARLLDNLDRPLIDRLPLGPVDELHVYAPHLDPNAETLRALVARLDPRQVVLGLHENWSDWGTEQARAALGGRPVHLRILPEQRPTHGRFLQWRVGERWHALTGNGDLTRDALAGTVSAAGAVELAVHTANGHTRLPDEGRTAVGTAALRALARPGTTGDDLAPVLLGAEADIDGLHVVLARAGSGPVVVSTSTDGSAGSWRELGSIPAGATTATFPPAAGLGSAVRASVTGPGGAVVESAVIFAYSPASSARPTSRKIAARPRPVAESAPAATPASRPVPREAPTPRVAPAATRPAPAGAPTSRPEPRVETRPERPHVEPARHDLAPIVPVIREDDPYADAIEEFAAAGWVASHEDGLWRITGSFGNPVPIAAVAATRLAQYGEPVLIQAGNERRWAFMAWDAPDLTLLNWPARNWRSYQIRPPADPQSRFRGGDLASVPGRVGPLNRQIGDPPPALLRVLGDLNLGFGELVKELQAIGG
jgi:hypothetical protein